MMEIRTSNGMSGGKRTTAALDTKVEYGEDGSIKRLQIDKVSGGNTGGDPKSTTFVSNRPVDAEFKALGEFADAIPDRDASGKITLFVERSPCPDCTDVIQNQFPAEYPDVDIEVYWYQKK